MLSSGRREALSVSPLVVVEILETSTKKNGCLSSHLICQAFFSLGQDLASPFSSYRHDLLDGHGVAVPGREVG